MDGESPYASGWYPDPTGRFPQRYHNGSTWTGDVAVDGRRFVDPLPSTSDPAAWTPAGSPPASGQSRGNGAAVVALVLGISSVVVGWLPYLFVVGAVCALVGIPFGVVARRRAKRGAGRGGMALTGLVLGVLGLGAVVVGVLMTVLVTKILDVGPNETTIECATTAGRASATGTVHNLDDRERDYLLLVRFTRAGTASQIGGDVIVQVSDVAPGATGSFATSITTNVDEVDCEVSEVFGGLPVSLD